MFNYVLLGLLWIALCTAIGLYISGTFSKSDRFYKVGIGLLMVSWLAGVCLLGVAITYS